MKRYTRIISFGVLVWLIPFIVAIPFYSPTGEILIDQGLFKSLMILLGSGTGAICIILFFRKITEDYFKAGLVIGFTWLIINWGLDYLILLPLSGMEITAYLNQIGVRYLSILIMTGMAGWVCDEVTKKNRRAR